MEHTVYSKKLCMNELRVERYYCEGTQFFDATGGEGYAMLIFVLHGCGHIRTVGDELYVTEGELLYIPEGERYDALWTGDDVVEYISFNIVSQKYDMENTGRYPAQVIHALSGEKTGELFREIFRMFATEDRLQKVRAMGLYYSFYAEVLPYLEALEPIRYSATLTNAIRYIEKRYAENFPVEELAAHLSISVSRLHHLFQKELSTTPVKYRTKCRIEHAAKDLRSSTMPLKQVAERNGFHSVAYFCEAFKEHTGMTPLRYTETATVKTKE